MQIRNKREFYRLWEQNVLGNRPRLFKTIEEAVASDAVEIGFREMRGGGGAWEKVPREHALATFHRWSDLGRLPCNLDEAVRNVDSTLIGEVCRTHRGWEGFIGLSQGLPMRPAIAAGLLLPRSGATTLTLIRQYMDSNSLDDLYDIFDLFPDATVEFACFPYDVGVIPNRQVIIWEIRNY